MQSSVLHPKSQFFYLLGKMFTQKFISTRNIALKLELCYYIESTLYLQHSVGSKGLYPYARSQHATSNVATTQWNNCDRSTSQHCRGCTGRAFQFSLKITAAQHLIAPTPTWSIQFQLRLFFGTLKWFSTVPQKLPIISGSHTLHKVHELSCPQRLQVIGKHPILQVILG